MSFSLQSASSLRYCAALVLLLALFHGSARAERVALVIGNSSYAAAPALPNPANDARDVAEALEVLGFEVSSHTDLGLDGMQAAVDRFVVRAKSAETALFYFAGHAFQVAGRNYLVPVDFATKETDQPAGQTLLLDRVIGGLAESDALRLIVLDACRDNPLALDDAAATEAGLARAGLGQEDIWIGYATQPDAVAFDGGGRNGTFTEAFLRHLPTQGQSIPEMMMAIRRDVIATTGGRQIPWEHSSLTRNFAFNPGTETLPAESLFFQAAAKAQSADLMELFLGRYPNAPQIRDARAFLDNPSRAMGRPNDDGETLWHLLQRTRLRRIALVYLERYPDGARTKEVQRVLKSLLDDNAEGYRRQCERLTTHPRDATANVAGVPFEALQRRAAIAIDVCRRAIADDLENPKYIAHLARALWAAGQHDAAIDHYEDAAKRGNVRAMYSLGLLKQKGDRVPLDQAGAIALYERAAEGGSADAATNLAVLLFRGEGRTRDVDRAIQILRRAAGDGSAQAMFNLGVMAREGLIDTPTQAVDWFRRAARAGFPDGYKAAAIMLDEGADVAKDAGTAAILLLLGAAADKGDVVAELGLSGGLWSTETIKEVQRRLAQAGHYTDTIDGLAGPRFRAALERWRLGGFDLDALNV